MVDSVHVGSSTKLCVHMNSRLDPTLPNIINGLNKTVKTKAKNRGPISYADLSL